MNSTLTLFGFASGIAANNPDCALGPWYLYYHPELLHAIKQYHVEWQPIIQTTSHLRGTEVLNLVEKNLAELSGQILPYAKKRTPFCVIGGDHSCGIATWSAVAYANRDKGDIGMIWIDAHMDSHTPETSATQNIHGMPVAHLLGHGLLNLCSILDKTPKLKPQNLCFIGIRSYEEGEAKLLEALGVKVYFMEEVHRRGIEDILSEACTHVTAATCGFGVSIDMDAIDPVDAPGVGYREIGGIRGQDLFHALQTRLPKQHLLGLEIAEFNPLRDEEAKTAKLLVDLIQAVYS